MKLGVGTWDTPDSRRAVSPQQLAIEVLELLGRAEDEELWDQSCWFGHGVPREPRTPWSVSGLEDAQTTAYELPSAWSCGTPACFAGWSLLAAMHHGYTPDPLQSWRAMLHELFDAPGQNMDALVDPDADKDDILDFLRAVAGFQVDA